MTFQAHQAAHQDFMENFQRIDNFYWQKFCYSMTVGWISDMLKLTSLAIT